MRHTDRFPYDKNDITRYNPVLPDEDTQADVVPEDLQTGDIPESEFATFGEAVEHQVRTDNSGKSEVCKKAAAIRFCVHRYPELYQRYREKLEE
jgi:hypothetical protein